jgi:hypothetical protein
MAHMQSEMLTFEEVFRAIRGGDVDCIIAFSLECAIMASPVLILFGAWLAR